MEAELGVFTEEQRRALLSLLGAQSVLSDEAEAPENTTVQVGTAQTVGYGPNRSAFNIGEPIDIVVSFIGHDGNIVEERYNTRKNADGYAEYISSSASNSGALVIYRNVYNPDGAYYDSIEWRVWASGVWLDLRKEKNANPSK